MNSSVLLMNRFFRNSYKMKKLLNPNNNSLSNDIICRSLKLWQIKTLRLMYKRSRLFDAVKRDPDPRSIRQEWYV